MEFIINGKEIDNAIRSYSKITQNFTKKVRLSIANKGVPPIRDTARSITKKRKYGANPKKLSWRGTSYGLYYRGNLAFSMYKIPADRIPKAVFAYVAPRIQNNIPANAAFGPGTGTANAYYAHMAYGGQTEFINEVYVPVIAQAGQASILLMLAEADKQLTRILKKEGWL